MSGPIKDFVVRGRDANGRRVYAYPDEENGYEPKRGTGKLLISSEDAACFARLELQAAGCTDVAIYQVHDDGREERLPSYEEALGEVERLRAVEALNVGAIDASLVRLGAVTGAIGPMPQRERHDARCLIHDGAGCSFEAGCDAGQALMPEVSPLAALEAAERRLLESARWTPGDRGFWIDPDDGTQWPREGAISDVRRRLAAKGGA